MGHSTPHHIKVPWEGGSLLWTGIVFNVEPEVSIKIDCYHFFMKFISLEVHFDNLTSEISPLVAAREKMLRLGKKYRFWVE
jgi:hypothetical protein